MSDTSPGIYFDEDKKHFIIPTYIPSIKTIEEGRIQLYTFSCEDLSFNKTSFNPSHPEYFKYNDRYGGKPFVEVSRISPKGSFFHCSYYFDNIRDAYYNHDELALRNELALQIISLLHPEAPPHYLEIKKDYEYLSEFRASPSGEYYTFANDHLLIGGRGDLIAAGGNSIEIFDRKGKFYSDFWLEDINNFQWESGFNVFTSEMGKEKHFWKGEDRVHIKDEDKYYHANGTPVEEAAYYLLRLDSSSEFFQLIYRNSDGTERIIEEKVAPASARELHFNPSLTACVWVELSIRVDLEATEQYSPMKPTDVPIDISCIYSHQWEIPEDLNVMALG